jgi:HPt (histidine-containing phosphotransfer) domain-containing protein
MDQQSFRSSRGEGPNGGPLEAGGVRAMHSATNPETADVIDLESLEARCLGNVELVERVLHRFAAELEADLATLAGALEASDTDTCRAVVHRLKGMSANVEAWPLHECAKEAETSALSRDLADLARQLERLHEMRLQLSTALKALMSL